MIQKDWDYLTNPQLTNHTEEEHWLIRQRAIERDIVNAYAAATGLDYDTAERELAAQGEILTQPILESNTYLRQKRTVFDRVISLGTLRQITDLGRIAIKAFEETKYCTIWFGNASIDYLTFNCWNGRTDIRRRAGISSDEWTFQQLKAEFDATEDRFCLLYARQKWCVEFTFGYKNT